MFERNPFKKFGLKKGNDRAKYIYSIVELGDTNEMLSKARRFNRAAGKNGNRYFVVPIGGLLPQANLIMGRRIY